ncbi:ABC transporter substrate-binding protein [Brucella abortus]|nr:ABC transporter substrate-binding protein [Brucella abortus]
MKIWAMPVSRPYMPNARRTAELMRADLAKVGVKADIVSMEWGEYLKKSSEKDRDGAVIMGWTGDNGDPDNFLGTLPRLRWPWQQQPRPVVLQAV